MMSARVDLYKQRHLSTLEVTTSFWIRRIPLQIMQANPINYEGNWLNPRPTVSCGHGLFIIDRQYTSSGAVMRPDAFVGSGAI